MMLSVAEALAKLLALAPVMGSEEVALADAAGRVLAAPAQASRAQPPFAASAMDGYAVRAHEAVSGAILTVVDEAAAGRRATAILPQTAAIRIFTGAPVPEEADTILIQENTTRDGDRITVTEAPERGAYIRPAGGDFPHDFKVMSPKRLTPRDLALLAAMNAPRVTVATKPLIALIPTGDELVLPGDTPGPDQIITSNNFGLGAMLQAAGAEIRHCPIARDTRESLLAALETARGADAVVTLGGASVGDHDLVAEVLGDAGLTLDFYKVAMRPGKPLMAGALDGMAMIGLPGNPVSALVCGEIFLRPFVNAMLGLTAGPRTQLAGRLSHPLEANGPREHYMRAALTSDAPPGTGGIPTLEVFENQDSSRIATLARANALVVRMPHAPALASGAMVAYIPLC